VKVGLGIAILVVAQYRAYREVWRELRSERERKTKLTVFAEPGAGLYVETPLGAANSLGFYLELNLGVQNDGPQNSVIRRFDLEIEETNSRYEDIRPSRRNYVQTRAGQQQMRNLWISDQPGVIVVPAHDVRAGILAFYVQGDHGLSGQVHCKLRLEDADGVSVEHVFVTPVVG